MNLKSIVIDSETVEILEKAYFDDEWFQEFQIPEQAEEVKRVEIQNSLFLLSKNADTDSDYLVINADVFFQKGEKFKPSVTFERILRIAIRHFNRNISIPIKWQQYNSGPLLSIFSQAARDANTRIYFNQNPDNTNNIYCYNITSGKEDINNVSQHQKLYENSLEKIIDAILSENTSQPDVGNFGILLSQPLGVSFGGAGTLSEWYSNRLNSEQKKFVDLPNNGPIRLRGAPGTGKTQSMAVKCLRDLYERSEPETTIAFLTHSSALAHEIIRGMFYALDPSEKWAKNKTPDGRPKLWIGTIYELAQEKLGYQKKGLTPLSLDGEEGKELQRYLIKQAIHETLKEPRIALGVAEECPDLTEKLNSTSSHSHIIDDIMNEFACVLDLENIKINTPAAERYKKSARETWQMYLPNTAERELILEIHNSYRALLRNEKMLSMDQMIADFSAYLETHEWSQLRERDGYDQIFIDEYHYFTRAESMTLHNLFKPEGDIDGKWPLIMAYDLKQSTTDVAIAGGISKFRNPGIGASVVTDLKQVYRSTPQISNLLRDIDAAFPAMDLEGEYSTYQASSELDDGKLPTLSIYQNDIELLDKTVKKAGHRLNLLPEKGRDVVVLCLNEELFSQIKNAGRANKSFVCITSREDFKELRYTKKKFVFSMPEYVAGLQFDTVYLIHANADDYDESLSTGARRRYVSRVYLGISRAKNMVNIACSLQHAGISPLFTSPLESKSLIK